MSVITAAPVRSQRVRGIVAVVTGLAVGAVLASAADKLVYSLDTSVFPFALAVLYRTAFGVLGGYLTARIATRNHAKVLGVIGTAVSAIGVISAVAMELGPLWYPVALALVAYPAAIAGGRLSSAS